MKYNISISYVTPRMNGQQAINISGVTQSIPTYSGEFYVATIHELLVSATGSTHQNALTNVLSIASASNTGQSPLSSIRHW